MSTRAGLLPWLAAAAVIIAGMAWVGSPSSALGDDNSAHFALAVHLAEVMRAGETNLWWHQSNLGLPLFAAYQPLPGLAMGAVLALIGPLIAPVKLFKASIVLCWALMPVAWYRGGRWYGLGAGAAAVLGLLTLTIHDPYAIGFGVRSATVRGLYTQHFGLLFLPLFLGSFKQHLDVRGDALRPAVLFTLTAMSHLWVGLYAAIAAAALLASAPSRLRTRLWRAVPVGLIAAVLLAWWLVPLLLTSEYVGGLPWRRQLHNGWPVAESARRLLGGAVFDTGRLPLLTALVIAGGLGLMLRWREPAVRHWLVLCAVTGVLFLGRTNLGDAYNLIPLHEHVNVMRYLTGAHICGLIAAAAALHTLCRWGASRLGRLAEPVGVGLGIGLAIWSAGDIKQTLRTFNQAQPGFAEVAEYLSTTPDHRLAVHGDLGTGSHLHRDLLPMLAGRGQIQSYAHGYHCTLSTYYAEYFDFSPAACALLDVGSIVARSPLPEDFPVEAFGTSWQGKNYTVVHPVQSDDLGIFSFVDVRGQIEGPDLRAIRPAVKVLTVPAFAAGVLPRVSGQSADGAVAVVGSDGIRQNWSADRARALLATLVEPRPAQQARVLISQRGLATYSATVEVDAVPQWLLLKVNMFPWWQATIDGESVPITHVAPNFMAVEVPPGRREVRFAYRNPPLQKAGALLSVLVLVGGLLSRSRRPFLAEPEAAEP